MLGTRAQAGDRGPVRLGGIALILRQAIPGELRIHRHQDRIPARLGQHRSRRNSERAGITLDQRGLWGGILRAG